MGESTKQLTEISNILVTWLYLFIYFFGRDGTESSTNCFSKSALLTRTAKAHDISLIYHHKFHW